MVIALPDRRKPSRAWHEAGRVPGSIEKRDVPNPSHEHCQPQRYCENSYQADSWPDGDKIPPVVKNEDEDYIEEDKGCGNWMIAKQNGDQREGYECDGGAWLSNMQTGH